MWADVHLGPEQAAQAHRMVKGKIMMPVHWATFDLAMHNWTEPAERLLVASQKEGFDLVIPQPGQSFEPGSTRSVAKWWPDLPWQPVEQSPVVSSGLADNPEERNEDGSIELNTDLSLVSGQITAQ